MDYRKLIANLFEGPPLSAESVDTVLGSLRQFVESGLYKDSGAIIDALAAAPAGVLEYALTSNYGALAQVGTFILQNVKEGSVPLSRRNEDIVQRAKAFVCSLPPSIELPRDILALIAGLDSILSALQASGSPKPQPTSKPTPSKIRRGRARTVNGRETDDSPQNSKTDNMTAEVSASLKAELVTAVELLFQAMKSDELEEYARMKLCAETNKPSKTAKIIETPATVEEPQVGPEDNQRSQQVSLEDVRELSDEAIFTYGQWPVVIAERGLGHMKQLNKSDTSIFKAVERKIRELSVGVFTRNNHAPLLENHAGVLLYKAKVTAALRIIYQIDTGIPLPERDGEKLESQFIRIYDICAASQIDMPFWTSVAAELGRRGQEYKKRCNMRELPRAKFRGVGVISPVAFSRLGNSVAPLRDERQAPQKLNESHFLELHRILAVEKFISFSQDLFENVSRREDLNFIFTVSPEENDIRGHLSSCLVLGRSGTGKTTTMLFRMIDLQVAAEKKEKPTRQLFVTKSRTLANKVKAQYSQIRGFGAAGDEAVFTLLDIDEDVEDDDELPTRFSELEDKDFPLFMTFDQLWKLLENDAGDGHNGSGEQDLPIFISFEFFGRELWRRFDEQLRKGLNPALVFNEFIGVIKGSEASLASPKGYMDRATYEGLSSRAVSAFSRERQQVYSLFESYQKRRPRGSLDAADRTRRLLEACNGGMIKSSVDFLYVDEVQDNLILDIAILKHLCPDPRGIFFAGDTAQTISVGSSFRFSDLKGFIHRLEENNVMVQENLRQLVEPTLFELSVNYRSHGGIVDAAAYIVSLLNRFFPYSIDRLSRETAKVGGPVPIFLSRRANDADFEIFASDENSSRVGVQLGAQQAIIVRDDAAVRDLQSRIGDTAIILTLYESKGMEFNDVLLYDFFTDSLAKASDWRALVGVLDGSAAFDERDRAILQREFKCLYVGLTRARERVWIWENSQKGLAFEASQTRFPVAEGDTANHEQLDQTLMSNMGLTSSYGPTEPPPRIGTSAPDTEWTKQGRKFFSKRLYSQAALCFGKARQPWWRDVARAYEGRRRAEQYTDADPSRPKAFADAADSFWKQAELAQTKEVGQTVADARILFSNAGKCYAEARAFSSAAEAYLKAENYSDALWYLRKAGRFNTALTVINGHSDEIDPGVLEKVKSVAKVVFAKDGENEKAQALCGDQESYLEFLEDHAFHEQHISYLGSIQQHDKAGEASWAQKEFAQAIRHFLQSRSSSARQRASRCLLDGLRAETPYGTNHRTPSTMVKELLALVPSIPLPDHDRAEVQLFQTLYAASSASNVHAVSQSFLQRGDIRCGLLAFDGWSNLIRPAELEKVTDADAVMALFRPYHMFGTLLRQATRNPLPFDDVAFNQLLGLEVVQENESAATSEIGVLSRSFIYRWAVQQSYPPHEVSTQVQLGNPISVGPLLAERWIRRALLLRLNYLVYSLHTSAMKSGAFQLCERFVVAGRCARLEEQSCNLSHPKPAELSVQGFNSRVGIHLHLISVLDFLAAVEEGYDEERSRKGMQGVWLARLFDVCYPASMKVGSISDLVGELIPRYHEVMQVVKAWIEEHFYSQRPGMRSPSWYHNRPSNKFYLTSVLSCAMISTIFDYDNTVRYLYQGQWKQDVEIADRDHLVRDRKMVIGLALKWFPQTTAARHNLGVHFIEHVVSNAVCIDLNILIPFIEDVGSQLILNHFRHYMGGRYNGLTLPRSWIVRAFFRGASERPNGSMPYVLVPALQTLLEILLGRIPSRQLTIRRKSLETIPDSVRRDCLARVCRVLALLGENSQSEALRSKVLTVFRSLGSIEIPPRWGSYEYFIARNWSEVSTAVLSSIPASNLDDMVTLYQGYFDRRTTKVTAGVRVITWQTNLDLMRQLMIGGRPSILAPYLEAHTTTGGYNEVTTSSAEKPAQEEADDDDDDDQLAATVTARREECAVIIQTYYRRYRKRCDRDASRPPQYAAYNRMATALLDKESAQLKPVEYAKQLRGPMPHVAVSMKNAMAQCQQIVDDLQKSMLKIHHEHLDDVLLERERARALKRDVDALWKKLQPTSPFHKLTSVPKLSEAVVQLPLLLERIFKFNPAFQKEMESDAHYALGIEAFLANATRGLQPTFKKPKRPVLNADDLDF